MEGHKVNSGTFYNKVVPESLHLSVSLMDFSPCTETNVPVKICGERSAPFWKHSSWLEMLEKRIGDGADGVFFPASVI